MFLVPSAGVPGAPRRRESGGRIFRRSARQSLVRGRLYRHDGSRGGRAGHVRSERHPARGHLADLLLRPRPDDVGPARRGRRDPVPVRDLLQFSGAREDGAPSHGGDLQSGHLGTADRHGSRAAAAVLSGRGVPSGLLPQDPDRRLLPRHHRTESLEVPQAIRGAAQGVSGRTQRDLTRPRLLPLHGGEPAREGVVDLPERGRPPARPVVSVGRRRVPPGEGTRSADPPGHRGHVVPLVSRHRSRIVRGSGARRRHQRYFVAIKVDRDERPDIDARYQQAVGAIAGQGGWPLTAFLTPDGKVFYGGTYFPPKDSYGRPSFRRVLLAMSDAYRTNKADTVREAEALHQALAEGRVSLVEDGVVNEAMLKESLDSLRGQFDPVNGGISGQQKFPHPGTMEWVMARFHRTKEEGLQKIFTRTLTAMAKGGVYDQVGGGFHRYSTDPRWIVPHFEKMLYDNAGLLANYVHAWQLTRDPLYRETAEGILTWAEEVLSDRQRGGYFASQDADVGLDDDGDYFTWTREELHAAVDADEARGLELHYEVGDRGEMHHNPKKNVLYVDREPAAIAKDLGMPEDRVRTLIP